MNAEFMNYTKDEIVELLKKDDETIRQYLNSIVHAADINEFFRLIDINEWPRLLRLIEDEEEKAAVGVVF